MRKPEENRRTNDEPRLTPVTSDLNHPALRHQTASIITAAAALSFKKMASTQQD